MKTLLRMVIFVALLTPNQVNAWWPFGPSNFDDCALKYQKEAKCARAVTMINFACKCKFDPNNCPGNYSAYSSDVWDCILDNIGGALNDQAAIAIFQSCVSKYK